MLSMPDLVKSDLSSLADRGPGRGREGSAWLPAPLETQPCPGAAPGHVSDPVASQSGGPHWQPRVLTASVPSVWSSTGRQRGGTACHSMSFLCDGRNLEGPGRVWNKMAAPVIGVQTFIPLLGWGRGFEGVGQALGKEFWPSQAAHIT